MALNPILNNVPFFRLFGDNPRATNMTSVQKMSAALNSLNIQHTNMYRVFIPNPAGQYNLPRVSSTNMGGARSFVNQSTQEVLGFFCADINLPGVSLATTEIRRQGIGPFEKKPYAPIMVDSTFQFMVDGEGFISQFFFEWVRYILNYSMGNKGMNGLAYSMNAYEVDYKVNYAVDIVIEVFDKSGRLIKVYTLYEAYPLQLGEVQMSYASIDEVMRLPVTFTYRDFELQHGGSQEKFFGTSNQRDINIDGDASRIETRTARTLLADATNAVARQLQNTSFGGVTT